jgi:hypothetical protein
LAQSAAAQEQGHREDSVEPLEHTFLQYHRYDLVAPSKIGHETVGPTLRADGRPVERCSDKGDNKRHERQCQKGVSWIVGRADLNSNLEREKSKANPPTALMDAWPARYRKEGR